jgi:Na+-driven multidrug efflux pump
MTLALAGSFGLLLMFAVQWLAEPIAEHFFAAAHVHLHSRVLPASSVIQLSRHICLAGFVFVLGEAIGAPARANQATRIGMPWTS